MATIIETAIIEAPAEAVWDVVSDFGAVHRRFAPGFVTDVRLEPGARIVTFASGRVFRELLLGCDHPARRLAYSIRDEMFDHHNASFQVAPEGPARTRLIWTADVLPDSLAPTVAGMMRQGLSVAATALARA